MRALPSRSLRWPMVTLLGAAALASLPSWSQSQPADQPQAPHREPVRRPRAHNGSSLDERIQAVAQALHLDPQQQFELRAVLLWQRGQVQRIWNDAALSAADRIGATRAIGKQATARIRAFLSAEQRPLFDPPPQPQGQVTQSPARPVQDWLHFMGSDHAAPPTD